MSQVSLEVLAERMAVVEKEIEELRSAVSALKGAGNSGLPKNESTVTLPQMEVDKELTKRAMAAVLQNLAIHATPVGALALQQLMAESGSAGNEFSRALIQMREE